MGGERRAWTLGYPPAYERAVRIPGNAKAPGGYVFLSKTAAEAHVRTHPDAARYQPYEIELPLPYEFAATDDYDLAARARHEWHQSGDTGRAFMAECGVCVPRSWPSLDHDLLVVPAPFINPDTGLPA